MVILIINSLAYCATFSYFYHRYKFSLLSFIWMYYAIFSVFAVFLLWDNLYFRVMYISENKIENINMVPYTILYLSFLYITIPLKKVKYSNFRIDSTIYRNRSIRHFCVHCYAIELIYVLIKLYQVYLVSQVGFGSMHDMEDPDKLLYSGTFSVMIKLLNYLGRFTTLVVMPFVTVYIINGFIQKHIGKVELINSLFLYIGASLAVGIVGGSRAQMFFAILQLMFFFILFKRELPSKFLHIIYFSGTVFFILVIFITSQITNERFEDSTTMTPLESVFRYLGEMWINLSVDVWGQTSMHPMGLRMFGYLFTDSELYDAYWYYKTDVHTWWFKTFLGDLQFEFGTLGAIIVILLMGLLIRKCMRKSSYELYDVGYILFIYTICITSLFDFVAIYQTNLIVLLFTLLFSKLVKRYTSFLKLDNKK